MNRSGVSGCIPTTLTRYTQRMTWKGLPVRAGCLTPRLAHGKQPCLTARRTAAWRTWNVGCMRIRHWCRHGACVACPPCSRFHKALSFCLPWCRKETNHGYIPVGLRVPWTFSRWISSLCWNCSDRSCPALITGALSAKPRWTRPWLIGCCQ